jgi:hypothetical protein
MSRSKEFWNNFIGLLRLVIFHVDEENISPDCKSFELNLKKAHRPCCYKRTGHSLLIDIGAEVSRRAASLIWLVCAKQAAHRKIFPIATTAENNNKRSNLHKRRERELMLLLPVTCSWIFKRSEQFSAASLPRSFIIILNSMIEFAGAAICIIDYEHQFRVMKKRTSALI